MDYQKKREIANKIEPILDAIVQILASVAGSICGAIIFYKFF